MNKDILNNKHYFLCMIMPAKNVEKYVYDAVISYISHNRDDILLIIIDDHSTDTTFKICSDIKNENETKILLKKNKLTGKVNAINYGFTLASASYYKFVDSDDILQSNFWDMLDRNSNNSKSFVHPLTTVSKDLEKIAVIPMPTQGPLNNKKYLRNLILLPKVAWTFKEMDIKDMFPIPHGVPFEDIWFSLYVYSKDIEIINEKDSAYLYRQHETQTFGNVSDINEKRINFRYKRIYIALKIIEKHPLFNDLKKDLISSKIITLYMLRKIPLKMLFIKSGVLMSLKHIILRDFKFIYELIRNLIWLIRK